jgi:predicted TIM-barrel fold metal-dependent hydrolase
MQNIDAQVHIYERNHPGRPWIGTFRGPTEVTGEDMIAAMDKAGVDAALLVSIWSMYRYDPSYALEVRKRYPNRFAVVNSVDPSDPDLENTISGLARMEGLVGLRIMLSVTTPGDAEIDRVLRTAAKHNLPVNFLCHGQLERMAGFAQRNPDTQIVIDHLGIQQPSTLPLPDGDLWADLPKLVALGAYKNVAIKVSGACTLSRQAFPYADIWDPLARIFDAFGVERCMWGTDWTRALERLTYKEAADAFRVTDRLTWPEKSRLMGGSLTHIYKWSPQGSV